ncbi:hypothetical protein AN640_06955 [Candidatus Epulonipiscium fishelsonii]|uniref:Uncharacterized protein n=1 Tax=Candidatus Epulonipiscium fishelsonii TaxID=77094 RepID=A0ACC8XGV9_9FIRM|nr:hypothetical protein AN640_06955 [Epulopiscium sp. SCG-D08WGA-EpuloA1]
MKKSFIILGIATTLCSIPLTIFGSETVTIKKENTKDDPKDNEKENVKDNSEDNEKENSRESSKNKKKNSRERCNCNPQKKEEKLKQRLLDVGYTEEQIAQKLEERKLIIASILKSYKLTEAEFKELKQYKKEGKDVFQAKLAEKNLTPEIIEKINTEIKNETKKMFPELKEKDL